MSSTVPVSHPCPNNIALVHSETVGHFPWWEPFLTKRNNADSVRANVGIDILGMTELQTTREVYLLPGGMTRTGRLSYLLRLIGTAMHGGTSLCRFSDIDEQSKGLCYWCSINIQEISEPRWRKTFFWCVYNFIPRTPRNCCSEIMTKIHSWAM